MESFSNNPASAGNSSEKPTWMGQPGLTQATPAGAGQPGLAQTTPTWVGQSGALPVGVQPKLLGRKASWPALRLIALWLKISAWIEGAVGVIVALVVGGIVGAAQGLVGALVTIVLIIVAAIVFMLIYAYAELILVFLATEKNTRKDE